MIRKIFFCGLLLTLNAPLRSQTLTQIKAELEKTPDPIGYVKFKLKKKFKIDTVTVISTSHFMGIADSLAYKGKVGKVYGPFRGENVLVKILGKAPNTFYRASQILLDTSIFRKKFADSLATDIINRIKNGTNTFEDMAKTYSNDQSSVAGGDMGWFIGGLMIPQFDKAITSHKKGEIFTLWTSTGLNIIKITDNPKKDNGFALLLRIFL